VSETKLNPISPYVCNKHKTITTNHNNIENIRTEEYDVPGLKVNTNSGSVGTMSNNKVSEMNEMVSILLSEHVGFLQIA